MSYLINTLSYFFQSNFKLCVLISTITFNSTTYLFSDETFEKSVYIDSSDIPLPDNENNIDIKNDIIITFDTHDSVLTLKPDKTTKDYVNVEKPYTILISFDGLRYDFIGDSSKHFKYIEEHGVKAQSLKPVFPTTTLPNHYSILSGMYPVNHGIIVNSFKDPFNNDYFSSNLKGSRKLSKWYIAENFWETARRQGIKTGACYWTCPELDDPLKNPDYLLEYDAKVSYFERIDDGFEWLNKDIEERPRFLTFYFEEADIQSHLYGTKSHELAQGLTIIDSITGYILEKLQSSKLFDSTNIIIVSDHGIMDFDSNNVIYIDNILEGNRYESQNYGGFMMIDANKNVINEIYDSLKSHSSNYDVYFRNELPEHLHFSNHPYISPIIVLAHPGWILVDQNSDEKSKQLKAVHGYDNNELLMHGVFYAMGPSFKSNFKTTTIQNIDIYPLLCEIFNIMPRNNIDGKLQRIQIILKDK